MVKKFAYTIERDVLRRTIPIPYLVDAFVIDERIALFLVNNFLYASTMAEPTSLVPIIDIDRLDDLIEVLKEMKSGKT